MGEKLSVYNQLTRSPADMFTVLKKEIGIKTSCVPFAVKAAEALKELSIRTQAEATNAANVFLSNIQTLSQGGITAEDYDKIDFVKRGKAITVSARVEAFLRAAARKGYRITDTVIAVPKEDADTTYFKEELVGSDIVYVLKDGRKNPDRKITAERITSGYFAKYICRLVVANIKDHSGFMSVCELSNDELIEIAKASDQGIYKARWVEYRKQNGTVGKRRVVSDEINTEGFWYKWTGEMVKKTVIRRALKRVREVLPELKETIYAFDSSGDEKPIVDETPAEIEIDIPMESKKVDLECLTPWQQEDVNETFELYRANPKLAKDAAEEIKGLLENGAEKQSVINTHYAAILNIRRSGKVFPIISPWFGELKKQSKEVSIDGKDKA